VVEKQGRDAVAQEMAFFFNEVFGDASQAISAFTGTSLSMRVEGVESMDLTKLQRLLGLEESPFIAIRADLYADIRGSLILLMDIDTAGAIAANLMKNFGIEADSEINLYALGDDELSVLVELTNIIASKISSRLSDYLRLNVALTPPVVAIDMPWAAIQDSFVSFVEDSPSLIMVRMRILSSLGRGLLLFVPDEESYQRIETSILDVI